MIGCVSNINATKFQPRKIACRNYTSYNPEGMCDSLRRVDLEVFYNLIGVNETWGFLKANFTAIFNKHTTIIMKKFKSSPAPWLTNDVKALMNKRDMLLRKSRRTNNEVDTMAYRKKRNEVNKAIHKAKSIYSKNLLRESSNDNDPKKFWKPLKSVYPT